MEELKPCPFCGGEAKITDHGGFFTVSCTNLDCAATIDVLEPSEESAKADWNRRAAPENKPLTLKGLYKLQDSAEFGAHIWVKEIKSGFVMQAITDVVGKSGIVAIWDAVDDDWYLEKDYGKTWLAYARRPEAAP